jgi:hypothetical protein
MLAEMVNIYKEVVRQVLHDQLNMTKVCAKMVPRNHFQELNSENSLKLKHHEYANDQKIDQTTLLQVLKNILKIGILNGFG